MPFTAEAVISHERDMGHQTHSMHLQGPMAVTVETLTLAHFLDRAERFAACVPEIKALDAQVSALTWMAPACHSQHVYEQQVNQAILIDWGLAGCCCHKCLWSDTLEPCM